MNNQNNNVFVLVRGNSFNMCFQPVSLHRCRIVHIIQVTKLNPCKLSRLTQVFIAEVKSGQALTTPFIQAVFKETA